MTMIISFYSLWIVFGFILWSDMDGDGKCCDMVLSWSVIQIVSGVFCCCFLSIVDIDRFIGDALEYMDY